MKLDLKKLGGQLGILFCLAGLVLIWSGWNGAATYDRIEEQFPYLISGGLAGLALVVIGVGLLVIQSARADRVQLEANLAELRRILDRMTGTTTDNDVRGADEGGSLVVAGPNAYHRPDCRLVSGRSWLTTMPEDAAQEAGLVPCRTCHTVAREVSL